jgi:hypothetical protein
MCPLLEFMAPLGVLPAELASRLATVDELTSSTAAPAHLTWAAPATVAGYMHVARSFIARLSGASGWI